MTEPAKDKAELLERLAKEVLCDGIIICHHQKSCVGCFAKADAAIAAIRKAGWAVVPVEPTEEMLDGFSEQNGYICSLDWENILAASPIPPGVKP